MVKSNNFLICLIFLILTSSCAHKENKMVSVLQNNNNVATEKLKRDTNYMELHAGSSPLSPLAADFNNDGYNDIAVVSHGDNHLKIFWGRPKRTFKAGPVYGKNLVGYHPGKIALVDWDNDGFIDILLACEGVSQVQLWKNTGDGFEKKAFTDVNFNPKSIQTADIDQDGLKDIVLGPHQGNNLLILWGKDKRFNFDQQFIKTNPLTENVEIADWNNDNKPDIFWIEKKFGSVACALNKGNRNFTFFYIKKPGVPSGMVKDGPEYVKLADLNDDGCLDAAVPLEVGKSCNIYYGNCDKGIASTEKIPAPSWGYSGLAAIGRDANHPPMLALGEEEKIFIAFKTKNRWNLLKKPAGSLPRDLSFIDLDQDGSLDILLANSAEDTIAIIWGPF